MLRSNLAFAFLLQVFATTSAIATQPARSPIPDPVLSMGQPPLLRITAGPSAGYDFDKDEAAARLYFDFTPEGILPHFGLDNLILEAAPGVSGRDFDAMAGAHVRAMLLRGGIEYNFFDKKVLPVLGLQFAARRGGLFRRGEEVRVDYRPSEREVMIGVVFNQPFQRYRSTRPRKKYTPLPSGEIPEPAPEIRADGLPPDMSRALGRVEHSIVWMDRLLTPKFKSGDEFEESAADYREHIRIPGHTFAAEDSAYHRELINAFTAAVGGDRVTGGELAATAESIIFERVVVPFNRLFGQNKQPHDAAGFIDDALAEFEDALSRHSRFEMETAAESARHRAWVFEVFRRTLESINDVTLAIRDRWRQSHIIWLRQSRLVWLPLNYGLRPEQYDTQREWNAIIGKLTAQEFTHANAIEYLPNEQFHIRLRDMIRATRRYHVLLIHDFQGRHANKETDLTGWGMVAEGYIRAFIDAIKAIDRGEREVLPQFILFHDQFFYQGNKSRNIITYLENLYTADDLDLQNKDVERAVKGARHELLATIASSPSLRDLDREALRHIFKVHVNVTHPYDPAFMFDSPYRDHRKIAFRDVFEENPGSGVGIVTGQGVADHYNPPYWDDRGMMLRGPSLLQLKRAAERLFISQGYQPAEVPECLKSRPLPADYEEACAKLERGGWKTPVLTAVNDTGYGDKKATVLKAAIYNLASPGGVLFAIDSLWLSEFWAGMFVSAALRGANVYPIAPSENNSPTGAEAAMFVMRETLEIMVRAGGFFAQDIKNSGGRLRVGLYAESAAVDEDSKRIRIFLDKRNEYPFLEEQFPIHPFVVRLLYETSEPDDTPDDTPKPLLHMKTQFFANELAWKIVSREEWLPALMRYQEIRSEEKAGLPNDGITPAFLRTGDPRINGGRDVIASFTDYLDNLGGNARDEAIVTFTIGSHNQDRRGMLLDGEVLVACAGFDAFVSLPDMAYIVGISTWPADIAQLDEMLPKPERPGYIRRLYHWVRDLL